MPFLTSKSGWGWGGGGVGGRGGAFIRAWASNRDFTVTHYGEVCPGKPNVWVAENNKVPLIIITAFLQGQQPHQWAASR